MPHTTKSTPHLHRHFLPRPSQATEVAAEVKRKLDKKEKKRKKREKKQQELEANGGTNGDAAEVKSAPLAPRLAACLI